METWLIVLLLFFLTVMVCGLVYDRYSQPDSNADSLGAFFAEGLFLMVGVVGLFLGLALAVAVTIIPGLVIAVAGGVLIAVVVRQIRRKRAADG